MNTPAANASPTTAFTASQLLRLLQLAELQREISAAIQASRSYDRFRTSRQA